MFFKSNIYLVYVGMIFISLLVENNVAQSKEPKVKKTGKFHALSDDIDYDHDYIPLGCWKTGKLKYFEDLETLHDELDGLYWQRLDTIKKCAIVSKTRRYRLFALVNNGECIATRNTKHYKKLGRSKKCHNGEGGQEAMDVYKLTGKWFQDSEDFEDDIILTKSQKYLIDNPRSPLYHDDTDLQSSAAMALWPENTIPYYVPPELAKTKVAKRFLAGIQQWQKKTCVKFVPRHNHRDWVQVFRERNPLSRRCASAIGRIGRYQPIRVGDQCPAGSLIHEWGHALGLWHEQSREDRDKFVKILWKNILPGRSDQFKKYRHFMANTLSVKYDYLSIMHYGKDYFSKLTPDKYGYMTTIKALDKHYTNKLGQRKRVTGKDAAKVNLLYGCSDFPYVWHTNEWSDCSTECGNGKKTRDVFCAKSDKKRVDHKRCGRSLKPQNRLVCYGKKCSSCPPNWHKIDKACYMVNEHRLSWFEARKLCLANGSDLLTLKSKMEETSIRSYLTSQRKHVSYYWLGAYYRSADGDFYWIDDNKVKYKDWAKNEPRWNVDCALLMYKKKWGTDSCMQPRKYICKKEIA